MKQPVISVLMPAYNAERFVGAAVESILSQTFSDLEFIIINDGSTDGTLKILENYAASDRRVRLFSRDNTGLSVALNDGLAMAEGEFIARMDADDVSLPRRLELEYLYMTQYREVVALGGSIQRMDEDGWPVSLYSNPLEHSEIDTRHLGGYGGAIIHPSAMIRTAALRAVGGYRPQWEPAEDLDLFLRLAEIGKLANLPAVILRYRCNSCGVSQTQARRQIEQTKDVVNQARARRGLPPLVANSHRRILDSGGFRRRMILESLRNRHTSTAWKHVKRTAVESPLWLVNPKWAASCVWALCRNGRARTLSGNDIARDNAGGQ